mmetsp:Transcript_5630/g.10238  ORF Transcript_5630/g.10238 Transcript_5630/m.10238 type:complete len:200 (-) Transcript_5630:293-892(-)
MATSRSNTPRVFQRDLAHLFASKVLPGLIDDIWRYQCHLAVTLSANNLVLAQSDSINVHKVLKLLRVKAQQVERLVHQRVDKVVEFSFGIFYFLHKGRTDVYVPAGGAVVLGAFCAMHSRCNLTHLAAIRAGAVIFHCDVYDQLGALCSFASTHRSTVVGLRSRAHLSRAVERFIWDGRATLGCLILGTFFRSVQTQWT